MSSLKRLAVLKRFVECNNQDNSLMLLINLPQDGKTLFMSSLMRLALLKRSVECTNQDNLLLLLINLLTKFLNVTDVKFEAIDSPNEVCRVQQPRQFVTAFNQFTSRYLNVTYVKFI